ncbi:MAG TPA: tRNA 4-thiouridine(8) synthase ThiI [Candidatus Atribacteria bacterium]|nr:tRNA 4-thiouridine(8) synthase ThiI [Candidatus Atribacteria bacterium]
MKAIGLISGGLDSALAVFLLKKQGIEVIGLNFHSPFWESKNTLRQLAQDLEIALRAVEVREDYLELVRNPQFGYGKNLNPCIDCKIWMLREAKKEMEKEGASFIFTGEVVGQRPKSQLKNTLRLIERQSGLEGYLLRPLSAKLLPPTIPEEKGWVKREELLDLQGRGRKRQLELAEKWGIKHFSPPAGGCLLTDPNFSRRLKDLWESEEAYDFESVELLKVGRHFRLGASFKLVVGRNQAENEKLKEFLREGDILFFPREGKGPLALGRGKVDESLLQEAASLFAYYIRSHGEAVSVGVKFDSFGEVIEIERMSEEEVKKRMI